MSNYLLKKQSTTSGFTLVELLVVIVIISILAAILMANFVGIRQRGRDAERKSNLRQVQAALELYRADSGTYPSTLYSSGCLGAFTGAGSTPVYMQKIPCDPMGTSSYNGGSYYYFSPSGNATYFLIACLENGSDKDSNNLSAPPAGSGAPSTNCPSSTYYSLQTP